MSRLLSPWLALVGFLAIAGFLMLTEHRAHVFGVVPYLLLLACPLLHFFMHRGHGGHASRHRSDQAGRSELPEPEPSRGGQREE